MLAALIDENISPTVAPELWRVGVDCYHLRDRGLLGLTDAKVWRHAMKEARAIITIDQSDFRRLASGERVHFGVVVIPSGHSRKEQLAYIMDAVDYSISRNSIFPTFKNQIMMVQLDHTVTVHAPDAQRTDHRNQLS